MNTPAQRDTAVEAFVAAYPATEVTPVGEGFLDYAADRLPDTLVELYRRHGLGWFGQQELELVDPSAWMPVLRTWFGADVENVPFAVTSFGHVYHVSPEGHVECLDPHFLTNAPVASSMDEFFGHHLPSQESHLADLRGPHQGARTKLGPLATGELYSFTPMLPLGGTVSPESLSKSIGVEHALLTHRMVRQQREH